MVRFSVVVPAYNAEKTIAGCVRSLLDQELRDYELIVVDDGSRDGTARLLRQLGVKTIQQRNAGPAAARNRGWHEAEGEFIVFTDSDCRAPRNLLRTIERHLAASDAVALGGTYKTANRGLVPRWVALEIDYRHSRIGKHTYAVGTYCFAVRRDILEELKGFDERFRSASGEDTDFCYRLGEAGHRILFRRDVFVYHEHNETLIGYLRDQFKRGKWRVYLYSKFPRRMAGDSYIGRGLLFNVAVHALLVLSIPVSAFMGSVAPTGIMLAVAVALHAPFGFYAVIRTGRLRESGTIAFALLRSVVWVFGAVWGIVNLVKIRSAKH